MVRIRLPTLRRLKLIMKIYLARHGQDQDNVQGILNGHRDKPLTELGIRQADILARKIKEAELSFKAIYCSPLRRARETAEIIAITLNTDKPEVLSELIERDFGMMTGLFIKDIESLCSPDIIKTETVTYFLESEGAETFPELIKRGGVVIKKISNFKEDDNILLVCHSDIGKMIYAAYYELDWKSVLTQFQFDNCELLLLSADSPSEDSHIFSFKQRNH